MYSIPGQIGREAVHVTMYSMYSVRDDPPSEVQKTLEAYDALAQRLLYARGITTQKDAALFLEKNWDPANPYAYSAMRTAAGRVLDAVANREVIGIYSDYDCDGIPAAAALYSTLRAFNHEHIVYYVPNRNEDGFGLNKKGIQHLVAGGVGVVCVLDCGTSDPGGVAALTDAGMDVIVIDHHLPGDTVPTAFAMLNPLLEQGIPEPHPCAAGITYVFLQALIAQAQDMPLSVKPAPGWEKWQLDIIGLSTLSDMVPLRGVNRQIVHYGLEVMRKSPRPGIQALCDELKLNQQRIAQDDLTFLIVPRINAASRMGDARLAFDLLTTGDIAEAKELATALTRLNNKRKTAVASMVREANKQAVAKSADKEVWVFGNRSWKPSLAGLVAQKLMETHDKTIFVWGQGGAEIPVIKGSCRSTHHNTFVMMQEVPDLFIESGGHAQAGGFTLVEAAEIVLEDRLNAVQAAVEREAEQAYIDSECTIRDIQDVLALGERFAPFGKDNEHLRIAIPNCTVRQQARFGRRKEHIRYVFADDSGDIDGITFFTDRDKHDPVPEHLRAVIGRPEWDFFRNRPRIRVLQLIS